MHINSRKIGETTQEKCTRVSRFCLVAIVPIPKRHLQKSPSIHAFTSLMDKRQGWEGRAIAWGEKGRERAGEEQGLKSEVPEVQRGYNKKYKKYNQKCLEEDIVLSQLLGCQEGMACDGRRRGKEVREEGKDWRSKEEISPLWTSARDNTSKRA